MEAKNAKLESEPPSDDATADLIFTRRGCCLWAPFLRPDRCARWGRMREAEDGGEWWWSRGWRKLREWSEIVAGPRWKTFIRRFNNRKGVRCGGAGDGARLGKFQYDPLSYALNFDEGNGHSGQLEDEYRTFSARFAVPPVFDKVVHGPRKERSEFLNHPLMS